MRNWYFLIEAVELLLALFGVIYIVDHLPNFSKRRLQ